VILWRAGLRIGEALTLAETDLDARRGAVLVRHGKGDKRREVGMDAEPNATEPKALRDTRDAADTTAAPSTQPPPPTAAGSPPVD
jgi:site-specific recombinase XerD